MLAFADIHKVYNNNVELFYKEAGGFVSAETDEFFRQSVIGLWSKSGGVKQQQLDIINELYSKDQPRPKYLYWELSGAICDYSMFSIPDFFTAIAATDKIRKSNVSRTFIRVFANILLTVATADEDVSAAEAAYISSCTKALQSV
jgi:hypothetical protein